MEYNRAKSSPCSTFPLCRIQIKNDTEQCALPTPAKCADGGNDNPNIIVCNIGTSYSLAQKPISAGGLEAGWRIVARRGWQFGWLAARGKYRGAPETMKKRESLLFLQSVKPGHARMPVGGCAEPWFRIIVQPVYQYGGKPGLAGGVEFFHYIG